MARWQNQGLFLRFCRSRFGWLLVLLAALFLVRAVWQIWQKGRVVSVDRTQVEEQLAELIKREEKLRYELALLQTPSGLEQKLREKFPVLKPGEGVIAIVPGEASTTTATSTRAWWQIFSRD